MSDDLDKFFNKKKSGGGKKPKPKVVQITNIGKKLEKTSKHQEERDREEQERIQREKDEEQLESYLQNTNTEDSEWRDFEDKEVDLPEGIKDLDLGPEKETDEENVEEVAPEQTKGWNVVDEKAPAPVQVEPVAQNTQPQVYIPVALRRALQNAQAKLPDMANAEEFPSLGEAVSIEKQQKEIHKREEQRRAEFVDRKTTLEKERAAAREATRAVTGASPNPNAYVPPSRRQQDDRTESPTKFSSPSPEFQRRAPNAYVPPHMRAQMQAAGTAPLKTNNRFEGLQDN